MASPRTAPAPAKTPLMLSARTASWRLQDESRDGGGGDKALAAARPGVLKRDKGTCLYCGFKSGRYQEIHHLNDDHSDHREQNLACICGFCHMNFHIGRVGLLGEAELVWLPELSATDVSHLARAIFVAIHAGGSMRNGAEALFSSMRVRADDARRRIGTSDPADLGEALLALDEKDYGQRGDKLEGIRLLPLGRKFNGDADVFPEMLDYWRTDEGPFGGKWQPGAWPRLLDKLN